VSECIYACVYWYVCVCVPVCPCVRKYLCAFTCVYYLHVCVFVRACAVCAKTLLGWLKQPSKI